MATHGGENGSGHAAEWRFARVAKEGEGALAVAGDKMSIRAARFKISASVDARDPRPVLPATMLPLGKAAVHLLCDRWVASLFTSTLVLMVAGGSAFLFPIYSKAIMTSLGYDDDKALGMLAVSKNLGASLGFLPSTLIYVVAPPWAVLPSAAAMNLLGVLAAYLMPYLAVARRIARPPVWLMCLYIAVGANSQSFATTGALAGSVRNFPDHRGHVLSLLLAFAGLGGDMLTQFERASDGAAFLLFMACLCAVLLPFACTSIRVISQSAPGAARRPGVERRGVMRFLAVSVLAAACLLIFHVVELTVDQLPRPAYYVTAIVLLVVLVVSLLVVSMKQESEEAPARGVGVVVHGSIINPTLPLRLRENHYSILGAVCTLEMLLIFVVTFAIGGGVQTPVDMIDRIGQSLGYKHGSSTTSKLVSLVSLLDYAGRLVGGFGSEYMVARYKLPRPAALTMALLLACFGHLLIALDVPSGLSLYLASAVMGFCLGALWTVVFVTISEVFGTRDLATLYSLAVLPSAAGSYVLNVQVAGRLYARELQRQGDKALATCCTGVQCFRESFFILLGVTLLGAGLSAVLALRMWPFYRAPIVGAGGVTPVMTDSNTSGGGVGEVAVSSIMRGVIDV